MTDDYQGTVGIASDYTARYTDFCIAMTQLRPPPRTWMSWAKSCDIIKNSNTIVDDMKGDWLFLMGDDHVFEPDIVQCLLARDLPVVAPLVLMKRPPFHPVAYDAVRDTGLHRPMKLSDFDDQPVQVPACGTAGMLIRREVLDALPRPVFERRQIGDVIMGEDLTLCAKIREAGYPIHVDPTVRMGHIFLSTVWPERREGQWGTKLELVDGEIFLDEMEYVINA